MYCNQCGKRIPDGSRYCNYCGVKQNLAFSGQETSRSSYPTHSISYDEPHKERKGLKAVFLFGFITILCAVAVVIGAGYSQSKSPVPAASAVPSPSARPTPVNGQIFVRPGYDGDCPFSVSVSGDNSYYIYLEYVGRPYYSSENRTRNAYSATEEDISFFIRPNSTVELDVPIGEYKLYYACGKTWYGKELLFGDDTVYSTSDEHLIFYADDQGYNGVSLELWLQDNGNFETENISAEEFPG